MSASQGVAFLVIAVAAVLGFWALYRRASPHPGITPLKYVTHIPSDLPPAMAGMLLVPLMTPDKLAATLLDLVRRGVIVMEAAPPPAAGRPSGDRVLHLRRDRVAALRPFEQDFVYELFDHVARGDVAWLGRVRDWWATHPVTAAAAEEILAVRLYQGLLAEGLVDPRAARRRQLLTAYGVVVACLVLLGPLLGAWSFLFLVVGGALVMWSQCLPGVTAEGAKVLERYKGFRRYLRDYGRMGEKPAEAVAVWEEYLPLAIVLGVAGEAEEDVGLRPEYTPPTPSLDGSYADEAEGLAYLDMRREQDPSLPEMTVVHGENAGLHFSGPVRPASVASPAEYLRHVRRHPFRALVEPAPWILLPLAMAVFYLFIFVVVR